MSTIISSVWALLQSQATALNCPFADNYKPFERTNTLSPANLEALAAASDLSCLPKIEYTYNPLPAQPHSCYSASFQYCNKTSSIRRRDSPNSIRLDPLGASLPYRSNINHARASRHWRANLDETQELLELLASDGSASDIEVLHGITLTRLAKKALQPGWQHGLVLATQYMFPNADEERLRQIAALMTMYFVFDDKVEETPNDKLHIFRDDFFDRLGCHHDSDTKRSKLQDHIDSILRGIEAEDAAGGNGGKEMIKALRCAFRCVRPDENGFQSVSDYLRFRRQNVGADFVIAAAKFSIKSSVSSNDARFARFLELIADHLGLVNDLASYDKELRALERGETHDMINLVDVVKRVTGLRGTDDAKASVWALQLQIERDMMEELEALKKGGNVTDEEWMFLEAVMATATGNVMFCMTTSRYGGEAARISNFVQTRRRFVKGLEITCTANVRLA